MTTDRAVTEYEQRDNEQRERIDELETELSRAHDQIAVLTDKVVKLEADLTEARAQLATRYRPRRQKPPQADAAQAEVRP
jgi:predicted  nucleic acid-binding Zn-ribbon protein